MIAFDNRGAGRTSAPDKPYSIAGMADDASSSSSIASRSRRRAWPATAMGGAIALELAAEQADRVENLVLIGTSPPAPAGRQRRRDRGLGRRPPLEPQPASRPSPSPAPWLYTPALLADPSSSATRPSRAAPTTPIPPRTTPTRRQAQAFLVLRRHREAGRHRASPPSSSPGEEDILVRPRGRRRPRRGPPERNATSSCPAPTPASSSTRRPTPPPSRSSSPAPRPRGLEHRCPAAVNRR